MTKPSLLPTWSTDAAADIDNPGTVKQALGWLLRERPPHGVFNWWQNLVGQWLSYLDSEASIPRFSGLEGLLADVPVGGVGMVEPPSAYPFQLAWSKTDVELGAASQALEFVACNGAQVAAVSGDYVTVFKASNGFQDWQANHAPTTNHGIISDGRNFIVAHDLNVTVYRASDGIIVNNIGVTTATGAMACDGVNLLIGDGTTVESYSDYDIGVGLESLDWSNNTTRTINDIAVNGQRVFVATANAAGLNHKVYLSDGTILGDGETDPNNANDGMDWCAYTRDFSMQQLSPLSDLVLDPVMLMPSVSGSPVYPPTGWTPQITPTNRGAGQNLPINMADVPTEEYISGADIGAAWVFRLTDGQLGMSTVFHEEWDSNVEAACNDHLQVYYGGALNSDGDALVARVLPPRLRKFRVVDTTDPYRAPFFGLVTLEDF